MTNWKYQTRIFSEVEPNEVKKKLEEQDRLRKRNQNVTDDYFVGTSNIAVRVRDGQIKVKGIQTQHDPIVDEARDDRYYFPVDSSTIDDALGVQRQTGFSFSKCFSGKTDQILDMNALMAYAAGTSDVVHTSVNKKSEKFESGDLEIEITKAGICGKNIYTVCVASNNPIKIHDAIQKFKVMQIPGAQKMEYAEAIKNYLGR